HADVARAVDEDAVAIHQAMDTGDEHLVLLQDFVETSKPSVREGPCEPADAAVRVRNPCAGQARGGVVDVVAEHPQIETSAASAAMTCMVPCVAGCDGPMLTTTAPSSQSVASNAARMGLGRTISIAPRLPDSARAAAPALLDNPCAAGDRRSLRRAGSDANRD